jgi:putative ABC transport system permease protein
MIRLIRVTWFRIRRFLAPNAVDAELEQELRFHVAREAASYERDGMNSAEAQRLALARLGGVERFKDTLRDVRGLRWVDDLFIDTRHALRLMKTRPSYALTVVLTLALGIGATSTLFTIVHSVLLKSLPYLESHRIVSISENDKGRDNGMIGHQLYFAWQRSARTVTNIAVYGSTAGALIGVGDPVELSGGAASAGLFDILGVRAAIGRVFRADEDVRTAEPVIVLSHALWMSRFGSDTNAIGRMVSLNGISRRVIGVLPSTFTFSRTAQFWIPRKLQERYEGGYFSYYVQTIARLAPTASLETARAELESIARTLDADRPAFVRGRPVVVMTLQNRSVGVVRRPLMLLMGAAFCLLLIACANVANLALARSAFRQREYAVRRALGAGRTRLIRQLLVEHAALASIGGVVGIAVAIVAARALARGAASTAVYASDIRMNWAVIAFTIVIVMLAAVMFGLAPAIAAAGKQGEEFKQGARATSSRGTARLRGALVVGEIAIALALVVGAGLLTKSFTRLLATDSGFQSNGLVGVRVSLSPARYTTPERSRDFYAQVAAQTRRIPGVERVALGDAIPLWGYRYSMEMKLPTMPEPVQVAGVAIDENYVDVVGLKVLEGRGFAVTDSKGSIAVAILSQTAARSLFPGESAVGRTLPSPENKDTQLTVVGVVNDVKQLGLEIAPMAQVYIPISQSISDSYWIVLRTASLPTVRPAIARVVMSIDPKQPISDIRSMEDELRKEFGPRKFNAVVVDSFAAVALLLAAIGLYGLMSHSVATRIRELGVRVALGAPRTAVLGLVIRQAVTLALLGIVIGAAASAAISRTLGSLLFGVAPHDVTMFALSVGALLLVALLASILPARRATAVDPMEALRSE